MTYPYEYHGSSAARSRNATETLMMTLPIHHSRHLSQPRDQHRSLCPLPSPPPPLAKENKKQVTYQKSKKNGKNGNPSVSSMNSITSPNPVIVTQFNLLTTHTYMPQNANSDKNVVSQLSSRRVVGGRVRGCGRGKREEVKRGESR